MHTLPLPKVTDDTLKMQNEIGSLEIAGAPAPLPASYFIPCAPLNSPPLTSQQLQFLLRVTPPALESEREYGVPACITIAQAILESATAAGWGSSSLFRVANNPFGIKYCHFGPIPVADGLPAQPPVQGNAPSTAQALASNGFIDAAAGSAPGRSGQKAPPSQGRPVIDYGAFDAQTWEVENGRKKIVMAQFQRFPNLTEAFRCHSLLLARSSRYTPAMQALGVSASPDSPYRGQPAPDAWMKFAERLGPKTSPLDKEHCGYSTNPHDMPPMGGEYVATLC